MTKVGRNDRHHRRLDRFRHSHSRLLALDLGVFIGRPTWSMSGRPSCGRLLGRPGHAVLRRRLLVRGAPQGPGVPGGLPHRVFAERRQPLRLPDDLRLFPGAPQYEHKALFWGILGALVIRAVFIFAASPSSSGSSGSSMSSACS
jgi:hypothetical protein